MTGKRILVTIDIFPILIIMVITRLYTFVSHGTVYPNGVNLVVIKYTLMSDLRQKKNTKINWVWWRAPVVPTTWEVEAGESLEPGRQRL